MTAFAERKEFVLEPVTLNGRHVRIVPLEQGHADALFDLGAVRFCIKTDERNTSSMAALRASGATKESVLRRHTRMQDGFLRNTVYYSVLEDEWPEMKRRLEAFLDRRG